MPSGSGGVQSTASLTSGLPDTDPTSSLVERFAVDGMSCEACSVTLQGHLASVPGVERVTVDYDSKSATVRMSDAAVAKDLAAKAGKLGYTLTRSSHQPGAGG